MPKWILIGAVALFSLIGITAVFKKQGTSIGASTPTSTATTASRSTPTLRKETAVVTVPAKKPSSLSQETQPQAPLARPATLPKDDFPNIDRIFQLFSTTHPPLPIVETITYSSTVSWLKGRPAWVSDYASYFSTSRHFIARSLNGKPDYFSQKVVEGSRFNVFKKDKNIQFYLLVDVSRCKMGFYYVNLDTNERVLLKTYRVGLGRLDPAKPSGTLTPLGRYSLGDRVAIYKPGATGFHLDRHVEMVRIFGTRWIPFEQEAERASVAPKGYGLQGAPWVEVPGETKLIEALDVIGAYDSDGCIRLAAEDIEELFAIIITKPTFIEIVKDFHEAKLPGVEVAAPSRL